MITYELVTRDTIFIKGDIIRKAAGNNLYLFFEIIMELNFGWFKCYSYLDMIEPYYFYYSIDEMIKDKCEKMIVLQKKVM